MGLLWPIAIIAFLLYCLVARSIRSCSGKIDRDIESDQESTYIELERWRPDQGANEIAAAVLIEPPPAYQPPPSYSRQPC